MGDPATTLVFLLLASCAVADTGPIVTVRQGRLLGTYLKSSHGRQFSAFIAIPFAKPPKGELRFKPPVPADPWKGVFDATEQHEIMCPQLNAILRDFTINGDEDCLYLNVYTPKVDAQKLPVLFFIHGGAFNWGHGGIKNYGPEYLLNKDLVLVTTNYRLGALGFLSTGDEVVSGNNGLKDQNLALRWVRDNIEQFGGDPEQITVYGQSAGGISTHFHMLSDMSKGMIKGAIISSGISTGFYSLSIDFQNQNNSRKLAEYLDCPTESSTEMVACLRKVDAHSIVDLEKNYYDWSFLPVVPFQPVVEPNREGAFITESSINIIKSGKAANIPFMTGITSEDGSMLSAAFYTDSALIEDLRLRYRRLLPMIYMYEHMPTRGKITKKIMEYWHKNATFTKSDLTTSLTDAWFGVPTDLAVRLHKEHYTSPIYYYYYKYRGANSFSELYGTDEDYGVSHSDELYLLFTTNIFGKYEQSKSDKDMSDVLVNLYYNFVKTGNPTPPGNDLKKEAEWKPVTTDHLEYLSINNAFDLKMKKDLLTERYNFFRKILYSSVKLGSKDEL